MYLLRLETPLGSLDYKNRNAFERFKEKTRLEYRDCPNCSHQLEILFSKYHENNDDLMVLIGLMCKKCNYSRQITLPYQQVIR